jgi:hypothetical protein
MIIILSIILSITTLLYQEIKIIRNIGNSVISFYAADSGIEKVLYYDRQFSGSLCEMFSYDAEIHPDACVASGDNDSGLYCNAPELVGSGCDPETCNDCTISFTAEFPLLGLISPDKNKKSHTVEATVAPNGEETSPKLTVQSLGSYQGLVRKVQLDLTESTIVEPSEVIDLISASANPVSSELGTTISIVADVYAKNGIGMDGAHRTIYAFIKTSSEGEPFETVYLDTIESGTVYDGVFSGISSALPVGAYYVDIKITDTEGNSLEQSIQSYLFEL